MLRQIKEKIAQKIPRLPRWGKRGIALLSAVACIAFSSFSVFALDVPVYQCAYSKPVVNSSSCLIEVVTENNWIFSIYFTAVQIFANDGSDSLNRKPAPAMTYKAYVFDNKLNLFPEVYAPGTEFYAYYFNNDGYFESNMLNVEDHNVYLDLSNCGAIKYAHGYNLDISPLNVSGQFVFSYGSENIVNDKLDSINSAILGFKGKTEEQLDKILAAIVSQGNENTQQIKDNADKNASEIKKNNDDNTQKIIDNQNELQQKEKDETQTAGDKSSSDTESAVPSVNEGFGAALKSFVTSMSYNGTVAKLPIPRAYLPAMSGITEEITLIPEQEFDMSQAINNYLPETLLQLIRHLFTVALILYCVYELYGLIQYVVTLRKGGKEE